MDKISKLSQAIRLGATFRPQCRGDLFRDGKSCAIAAAYEAVTGNSQYGPETEGEHPGSVLQERFGMTVRIWQEIVNRNNGRFGFPLSTREEIADWLESEGL